MYFLTLMAALALWAFIGMLAGLYYNQPIAIFLPCFVAFLAAVVAFIAAIPRQ